MRLLANIKNKLNKKINRIRFEQLLSNMNVLNKSNWIAENSTGATGEEYINAEESCKIIVIGIFDKLPGFQRMVKEVLIYLDSLAWKDPLNNILGQFGKTKDSGIHDLFSYYLELYSSNEEFPIFAREFAKLISLDKCSSFEKELGLILKDKRMQNDKSLANDYALLINKHSLTNNEQSR